MQINDLPTAPKRKTLAKHVPQLLISIRSQMEWAGLLQTYIEGRPVADVFDLKDPSQGALAPAPESLWQATAEAAQDHPSLRLSAALGEFPQARQIAGLLPERFDFAKMGASGHSSLHQLDQSWRVIIDQLSSRTEFVAVAYADHRNADTLPVEQVVDGALAAGIKRVLIDTFCKNGQTSLDHLSVDQLLRISRRIRQANAWWALAGSINWEGWTRLRKTSAQPNCIGLRGAVCEGDRQGDLSLHKCEQWYAAFGECSQVGVVSKQPVS